MLQPFFAQIMQVALTGEITYVDAGFNIAAMPLYEEVE